MAEFLCCPPEAITTLLIDYVVVHSPRGVRLCNPMDCSTPGFPVPHHLPEFSQAHGHCIGDAIQHLILCRSLLLLPSVLPSISDFSNESSVCIKWPKYWSFSFSISLSSEYSGLISLKIGWLDLLAVQRTFSSLLQDHSSKASIDYTAIQKKVSFHSNPKERQCQRMLKLLHNYSNLTH